MDEPAPLASTATWVCGGLGLSFLSWQFGKTLAQETTEKNKNEKSVARGFFNTLALGMGFLVGFTIIKGKDKPRMPEYPFLGGNESHDSYKM